MNQVFITIITASLATLLCVFGVQFALKDREFQLLSTTIDDLAVMAKANADTITAFSVEQQNLRESVNSRNTFITDNITQNPNISEHDNLIERIEYLEDALERLSVPKLITPETRMAALESRKNERSLPAGVLDDLAYKRAETYFENDSGRPIGDYSDSIASAIHSVDAIDLQTVECRKSICKITYNNSSSFVADEGDDLNSYLADKLMFGVEGQTVELRYADDELGNQVIYAEVR